VAANLMGFILLHSIMWKTYILHTKVVIRLHSFTNISTPTAPSVPKKYVKKTSNSYFVSVLYVLGIFGSSSYRKKFLKISFPEHAKMKLAQNTLKRCAILDSIAETEILRDKKNPSQRYGPQKISSRQIFVKPWPDRLRSQNVIALHTCIAPSHASPPAVTCPQ